VCGNWEKGVAVPVAIKNNLVTSTQMLCCACLVLRVLGWMSRQRLEAGLKGEEGGTGWCWDRGHPGAEMSDSVVALLVSPATCFEVRVPVH